MIPPRVVRGQTIGVIAPAGPIKPKARDQLARGLDRLASAFTVRVGPSIDAPRGADLASYLSATDEIRTAELAAMLADPDIRAIVVARGGYGITRILPRLDPELVRRDPKPIVGFSDATALLAWAHAAGARGIHGPTVGQLGDLADLDVDRLVTLLTDPRPLGEQPWSLVVHGRGTHRGALVPANLSMASLLVGTPWPLPLAGAIALFEEVGEKPYELDRYLTQLALTGVLATITAVVLGELVRCTDPNPPTGEPDPDDAAMRVFVDRFAALPWAAGAPVGHGTRNAAVPFGAACELDLDRGVLSILEAAVV
ncbi:MAG: LD-carboxypeptidase [Kofleriaceae bacterium]